MAIWSKTCLAPEWQWSGRRRVLIESPDAWTVAPDLEAAGYEVVACRGPGPGERCPLLHDGHCATASAADVIVSDLPWTDGAAIERALSDRYPGTPVIAGELPQASKLIAMVGQASSASRCDSCGDAA
jgi:hypothetical protein